jgi:hypothetical protein
MWEMSKDFWRQAWALGFFVTLGLVIHVLLPQPYTVFWAILALLGFVFACEFMPTSPWPFRRRRW